MLAKVRRTIERHRMFEPGLRLGVAVSGGADSLCLLHVLHQIAPQWNLHLSVLHIDHGMRGEASRADAAFVRDAASAYRLPFLLRELTAADLAGNLEQAARLARLKFFTELIGSGTLDRVATGHTLSDQAETVLYRILRGCGIRGLRGILPRTDSGLLRPLLEVTRAEVESWMRARGFEWRTDETNQQRVFLRNRIRANTLPHLRNEYNPNLDEALAQLANLAREEEEYWAETLPPVPPREGVVYLSIGDLTGVAPAIARRKIRDSIAGLKGNLRRVDYTHVETILEMARSSNGSGRGQIPGLEVTRSFEWLRIAPLGWDLARSHNFEIGVSIPGSVMLPEDGARIDLELHEYEEKFQDHGVADHVKVESELDWQRLTVPTTTCPTPPDAAGRFDTVPGTSRAAGIGLLTLRNWRPGDQYRRIGELHQKKIKVLFQEHRIPLWERPGWPVLVRGQQILWTRRFGSAAEFAPGPGTQTILRVNEKLVE